MPRSGPANPDRRSAVSVVRGISFGLAIALGAVAIWLIVTSTDQKRIEIGILTGLWGLLLGAFAVLGTRSHGHSRDAGSSTPGQGLDLRQFGEIERAAVVSAVAAARREFEVELEEMLRREVQAGLAQEIAGLRADVASLRNELLEKVGGQLRLERIETTRLIGSDLEALQQELRQLREIGGSRESDQPELIEHAPRRNDADVHDAEIVVERVIPLPDAVVVPEQAAAAEPVMAVEPAAAPAPAAAPEPAAAPQSVPAAAEAAAPAAPADPFASMPRIRPFTEFALDPTPSTTVDGATEGDVGGAAGGRHSSGSDEKPARGGRRHRASDDGNDVLAKILARESRH